MEIKKDVDIYELRDDLWGGADDTLQIIIDNGMEEEFCQLFHDVFWDEIPDLTEVNDWLRFDWEDIFETLGIEEDDDDEDEEFDDYDEDDEDEEEEEEETEE